jgi:hypothetical protein
MFKTICISSFCFLNIFKMLVKILTCNALIAAGSCLSVNILAIYVFTVSSYVCCSFHHIRHSIIRLGFTISHKKKSEDYTNKTASTVIICCAYFEVRFLRRVRQDSVTKEKRGIPGTYLMDWRYIYKTYISNNNEIQENETYASDIRIILLFPSLNCGLSQLKSVPLSRTIHIHTASIHVQYFSSVYPSFLSTIHRYVMNYETEVLSLDILFTSRLSFKRIRYLPRKRNSTVVCDDMDGMVQEGIMTWHNALYCKKWVESISTLACRVALEKGTIRQ